MRRLVSPQHLLLQKKHLFISRGLQASKPLSLQAFNLPRRVTRSANNPPAHPEDERRRARSLPIPYPFPIHILPYRPPRVPPRHASGPSFFRLFFPLQIFLPNSYFFRLFLDFGSPWRRFLAIFPPETGPRRLLFRCFFENGDFLKIVLPLWWEHSFRGSDPPKIGPESDCERQRQEKTIKIASGAISGRTFSLPVSFFVDFGFLAGSQNGASTEPGARISQVYSTRF